MQCARKQKHASTPGGDNAAYNPIMNWTTVTRADTNGSSTLNHPTQKGATDRKGMQCARKQKHASTPGGENAAYNPIMNWTTATRADTNGGSTINHPTQKELRIAKERTRAKIKKILLATQWSPPPQ